MKLFKKVAILSASLAMVVASGLVIGKAGLESASAAEEVVSTLDFTAKKVSTNNYNEVAKYGTEWEFKGGNTYNATWNFVKFGGKNDKSKVNYIKTIVPMTNGISKASVTTNAGNLTKVGTLNSWKLIVASDAEFNTTVDEVEGSTMTKGKSETLEFKPTTGVNWAENLYYKIELVTTGAGTNGFIWLNKVELYGDVDTSAPSISITNKLAELEIGAEDVTLTATKENADEAVVSWSSSVEAVATVSDEGVLHAVAEGKTIITASITVGETEYKDSFELSVTPVNVEHSSVSIPVSGKTYKLGFVKDNKVYYFNSQMELTYYASVSTKSYDGIDVVVERKVEGWTIKYGEKYILPVVSTNNNKTYVNFKYSDSLNVYATYMLNKNTFRWQVSGKDTFLGCDGIHINGAGSEWSKIGTYSPICLLEPKATAVAPTDAEVVSFFANEHMHTEIADTEVGTGLCKTNKWYAFAKEDYTALTEAQKTLFVSDVNYTPYLARYNAWAVANGDSTIAVGTLSQVSTRANTVTNNNNMMIIVIVSLATAISFAGLFVFLKKRKENR